MLADPVGRAYAEALFAIALERGQVEEIGLELEGFTQLVRTDADLDTFLSTPVLEPPVKIEHLKKAFSGNVSEMVADFLCLLVEKRRTHALNHIAEAYRFMADRHANRQRVSVSSATPLSPALRGEIEELLRSSLSKDIVLENETDPGLMGGAVISIGDKVYDGSIRSRLSQFRKQIKRSRGYEAQG